MHARLSAYCRSFHDGCTRPRRTLDPAQKCSIFSRGLYFAYKLPIHVGHKLSHMAGTESAQHALVLLARNCEQTMREKLAVLDSSVKKLAALRKDPREKRLALVTIMSSHEKYIIMLKQAHEDAISNVLPVVAKMDEAEYAAGSWKVQDSYACNCSQWNYEHRCHGIGHFGSSNQEYIFTPVGCKRRNSDE